MISAYAGSSGELYTYQTGTGAPSGEILATGTSPALTADNYDATQASFAAAVHASNGDLVTYNDNTSTVEDSGVAMASGSSPAIG